METDADRLESIKALGGLRASVRGQYFWAIFDNAYIEILDGIESTTPALSSCRTSDIERVQLVKDDVIEIDGKQWRMKTHQPDGTGMSIVALRK